MIQGVEPIRMKRFPAGGAEARVADLFVGPAPFAVSIRRGFRWEWDGKAVAELGEHGALEQGGGVRDVVESGRGRQRIQPEEVRNAAGSVFHMNLIDPASIGSRRGLGAEVDDGLPGQEVF